MHASHAMQDTLSDPKWQSKMLLLMTELHPKAMFMHQVSPSTPASVRPYHLCRFSGTVSSTAGTSHHLETIRRRFAMAIAVCPTKPRNAFSRLLFNTSFHPVTCSKCNPQHHPDNRSMVFFFLPVPSHPVHSALFMVSDPFFFRARER